MNCLQFYSMTGGVWFSMWLYRIKKGEDIKFLYFDTSKHNTWIYLHIIMYILAGYIVNIKEQKLVCLFYIIFEVFEYVGKRVNVGYLNNTLNLPNRYIIIHDITMNLAAQIVGLALSERLQIIIKSGHLNSEKG